MNETKTESTSFADEDMLGFYRQMLMIRQVEQHLSKDWRRGIFLGRFASL